MADTSPTARPARGSYPRRPHVQERIDRLAAHVADGGSMIAFAKAEGVDRARGYQLWRMLCADMGPQAI